MAEPTDRDLGDSTGRRRNEPPRPPPTRGPGRTHRDRPTSAPRPHPEDRKLDELLQRIKGIATPGASVPAEPAVAATGAAASVDEFIPLEPASLAEASLTQGEVEALMLKLLAARGDASGRQVSDQLRLPFLLIEQMLAAIESRTVDRSQGRGADERLRLSTDRHPGTSEPAAWPITAPISAPHRSC